MFNNWFKKGVLVLSSSLGLCFVVSALVTIFGNLLVLYTIEFKQPGGFSIQSVTLTAQAEPVNVLPNQPIIFSTPTSHIDCTVNLRGLLGIPLAGTMWFRWYHEDKQIAAQYLHIEPRLPISVSIDTTESKSLPIGKYRIDIFLENIQIRTVEFEIR